MLMMCGEWEREKEKKQIDALSLRTRMRQQLTSMESSLSISLLVHDVAKENAFVLNWLVERQKYVLQPWRGVPGLP